MISLILMTPPQYPISDTEGVFIFFEKKLNELLRFFEQ
jgi:hypothetical protein